MIFPLEGEKHRRCLGAIHVVIPEQYISTYIAAFSARLNASYGVERQFRHDFYYRDNEGNSIGDKNLSDETLMYALLKREAMPPHLCKALDIAVDLANDTRQFSGESDKQSPMPVFPPVATPAKGKKKRKKIPDTKYREAIGLVLGKSMPQSEAEAKCGLWVGALSKGKGAKLLDEATKAIADISRLQKDDGIAEDYLYNEVRHKEDRKK